MSELHHLEKKYGIRVNLLNWSGDNYESGTLNALIKISGTDAGRILLESIAYHVRHNPQNLLRGVVEIRPYGDSGCNGMASPEKTTKAGKRIQPVVKASFNPISAFYKDPMQAWIYANSKVAVGRDNLGPEGWERFEEIRKYSFAADPSRGEKFFNRLQKKGSK